MATEAQRLIGISLTKIAQSRAHRGGVSLHKNLLVATVLQKARYIFMEEAYHMVHAGGYCTPQASPLPTSTQPETEQQSYDDDDDNLVALTAEEAGVPEEPVPAPSPSPSELTYLDLDRPRERERCKRRRAVTEWETEEAVLSILPKRSRPEVDEEADDSVFLDEAALFSDCVAREAAAAAAEQSNTNTNTNSNSSSSSSSTGTSSNTSSSSSAMEIDRITSLVSIFSFGGLAVSGGGDGGLGKLARSVSTPDLCSAQAKESAADALQQRPFLAMTV